MSTNVERQLTVNSNLGLKPINSCPLPNGQTGLVYSTFSYYNLWLPHREELPRRLSFIYTAMFGADIFSNNFCSHLVMNIGRQFAHSSKWEDSDRPIPSASKHASCGLWFL